MKIAGEMQVDLVHRDHLRIPTTGRAAFDAEHGPQRGLADADNDLLAEPAHGLGDSHRDGGFAFPCRSRTDARHQDESP